MLGTCLDVDSAAFYYALLVMSVGCGFGCKQGCKLILSTETRFTVQACTSILDSTDWGQTVLHVRILEDLLRLIPSEPR